MFIFIFPQKWWHKNYFSFHCARALHTNAILSVTEILNRYLILIQTLLESYISRINDHDVSLFEIRFRREINYCTFAWKGLILNDTQSLKYFRIQFSTFGQLEYLAPWIWYLVIIDLMRLTSLQVQPSRISNYWLQPPLGNNNPDWALDNNAKLQTIESLLSDGRRARIKVNYAHVVWCC